MIITIIKSTLPLTNRPVLTAYESTQEFNSATSLKIKFNDSNVGFS